MEKIRNWFSSPVGGLTSVCVLIILFLITSTFILIRSAYKQAKRDEKLLDERTKEIHDLIEKQKRHEESKKEDKF